MKTQLMSFFLFITGILSAQGNFGAIQGKIFEKSEGEVAAEMAKVWVEHAGSNYGALVDESGRFKINAVPVGTYQLKASYFGDTLSQVVIANVKTDGIANVGRINILEDIQFEDEVVVTGLIDGPLLDFGDVGQTRISSLDIMKSPVRNSPKDLIVSRNSDIKLDADGNMMIRGGRPNNLAYFIDGVRTGEIQTYPSVAIGSITVYSSAIPAKYGDTTGGVIIMETKSYHDLYRAWKIMSTASN